MAGAENALRYLESMGLTDVILPFVLIFTVIFAILQKAKLFGEESKKYNVIFSLVVGLLVVIPHVMGRYPAGSDVVDIINKAIPSVSILIIAIIMFLVLAGIFFEPTKGEGWFPGVILIFAFIAVGWIFGNAAGWWENMPFWLNDPDMQALIVIILVFGIIIWFVTSEDSQGGFDKFAGFIKKAFKD